MQCHCDVRCARCVCQRDIMCQRRSCKNPCQKPRPPLCRDLVATCWCDVPNEMAGFSMRRASQTRPRKNAVHSPTFRGLWLACKTIPTPREPHLCNVSAHLFPCHISLRTCHISLFRSNGVYSSSVGLCFVRDQHGASLKSCESSCNGMWSKTSRDHTTRTSCASKYTLQSGGCRSRTASPQAARIAHGT